jgi:uncharacterized membrane protein
LPIDARTEERLSYVEMKVATLETRLAVAENNIQNINEKLNKIESNTTWLLRIIIGAIILAVLGFVLTQGANLQLPNT